MGPDGNILPIEEVKKLPRIIQEGFIPIQKAEEDEVFGMNRHDRRKWYALNKHRKVNHEH